MSLFYHGEELHYKVIAGIPQDSKIIDVRYNGFDKCFDVLIESEVFNGPEEANQYPTIDIALEKISTVSCE